MPSLVQPAKVERPRPRAGELMLLKEPWLEPERRRMWGKQGQRHPHACEDQAGQLWQEGSEKNINLSDTAHTAGLTAVIPI